MTLAAGLLISASTLERPTCRPASKATMVGYFACSSRCSSYPGWATGLWPKMIPTIFEACSRSLDLSEAVPRLVTHLRVVIGFVAAFGALGRGSESIWRCVSPTRHRQWDRCVLDLRVCYAAAAVHGLESVRPPNGHRHGDVWKLARCGSRHRRQPNLSVPIGPILRVQHLGNVAAPG